MYPILAMWHADTAAAANADLHVNESSKTVTITAKGIAPATALLPTPPAVFSVEPAPVTPPPAVALALGEAKAEEAKEPFAVPKTEVSPSSSAVKIVAEPMLPKWEITPGSLHVQLEAWTKKAGYQLVWSAETDLDMQSHASFRSNFVGAINQLFEGLHAAGFPLTATVYQANNVLEVGDK